MWNEPEPGRRDEAHPEMRAKAHAAHPDPEGRTAALIGRILRENLHVFTNHGYRDIGVFLDWSSCFQPPRALHEVGAHLRSQKLTSLWFTHALVTTLLCVERHYHQTPFMERGWNAFASACAWLIKHPEPDAEWPRVLEVYEHASVPPEARPPPPLPEAFAEGGELAPLVKRIKLEDERELLPQAWAQTVVDALKVERELAYALSLIHI